jgi:hypothetical protein
MRARDLPLISTQPPCAEVPLRCTIDQSSGTTKGAVMRTALSIQFAVAAAAIAVLTLPAAPANAAESAIVTIGQLEAQGFDVKVDRIGSAPLDECVVTNVRNPRDRTEVIRVDGRGGRDRVLPVVVGRNITVSLDCSNR